MSAAPAASPVRLRLARLWAPAAKSFVWTAVLAGIPTALVWGAGGVVAAGGAVVVNLTIFLASALVVQRVAGLLGAAAAVRTFLWSGLLRAGGALGLGAVWVHASDSAMAPFWLWLCLVYVILLSQEVAWVVRGLSGPTTAAR